MKPDRIRMQAWTALLQANSALMDVLAEELEAAHDLPLTYYDVLVWLSAAPDHRLRMQELADRVLLSKSGLTRLVDRMERDGLTERVSCPSDRRGTFAAMTKKGEQTLQEATPTHLRGVQQHFGRHLSAEEAETMRRCLTRILEHLGRADTPGAPAS